MRNTEKSRVLKLVLDVLNERKRFGISELGFSEEIFNNLKNRTLFSPSEKPLEPPFSGGTKRKRWESLKNRVLNCPVCRSHVKPGKKVVFGSGSLEASIFFCGEAPGAEEEEQGEVFVGKAGQLLMKIVGAMGFKRSDVYIGNIMNWRPETTTGVGNRPPTAEEMAFCLPYLKDQVSIVEPQVIVALGATATNGLMGAHFKRPMRE
ncbi:MAG: uracil-DNA glycosylase, partial [Puniceicoccales bacterium]|nr:uracil-DNA glycosylase [Puniceicoccales bacterium]